MQLSLHDSFRSLSVDPSGSFAIFCGNKMKPTLWEIDQFPADVRTSWRTVLDRDVTVSGAFPQGAWTPSNRGPMTDLTVTEIVDAKWNPTPEGAGTFAANCRRSYLNIYKQNTKLPGQIHVRNLAKGNVECLGYPCMAVCVVCSVLVRCYPTSHGARRSLTSSRRVSRMAWCPFGTHACLAPPRWSLVCLRRVAASQVGPSHCAVVLASVSGDSHARVLCTPCVFLQLEAWMMVCRVLG